MKIPISNIVIGERQRIDLGDLSDLSSMAEEDVKQICPIVLGPGNLLIDGRRRLAKAIELGWNEIEAVLKEDITEVQKQKMEFLADVGRKDRTWQERCIAIAKIHNMMKRERALEGETWTVRAMEAFSGIPRNTIQNHLTVAAGLLVEPRDEELWSCENMFTAFKLLSVERQLKVVQQEMERRRAAEQNPYITETAAPSDVPNQDITSEPILEGEVTPEQTAALLTLEDRVRRFNTEFPNILPLVIGQRDEGSFVHGFWFVGGGNISSFYGSYQIEYLKRVNALFFDIKGKTEVVHLFSGSISPSPDYSVIGLPDAGCQPDLVINAEQLSSYLPFKPRLIYADPPYSQEDSEHYANAMVNRAKVIEECALVLRPGGYIVWLDQALPVFSNNLIKLVGAIAYIRSTGNRFRVISIFQRNKE